MSFRARLGRWWKFAAVAALMLAVLLWMLTGVGFENPGAARDIALFMVLPLLIINVVYAVVAWRYQQRH